jgi:hypothetical protein
MRQISSALTWWQKKVSSKIFFGFLGLWILAWISGVILKRIPPSTLILPLMMAALMTAIRYALMHFLRVFSFVDKVWIDNDDLVVRNADKEDRFPIANITDIYATLLSSPERIELTLSEPCRFGREIVFMPPFRLLPFFRHPLAEELSQLVDNARLKPQQ